MCDISPSLSLLWSRALGVFFTGMLGAISLAPKSMNWWSPNDHCWMFLETTEKCLVFGFSHQLTYPPNELQLPSLLSTVLVPMLSSLADTFSLQIKAHCPCFIWKCQILQLTSVNKLINPFIECSYWYSIISSRGKTLDLRIKSPAFHPAQVRHEPALEPWAGHLACPNLGLLLHNLETIITTPWLLHRILWEANKTFVESVL